MATVNKSTRQLMAQSHGLQVPSLTHGLPEPGPEISTDDLGKLCRAYTNRALAALLKIIDDDQATANARTAAAVTIIERGHGKSAQQINTTHTDMTALHLEALRLASAAPQQEAIDITPLPSNPFQATDIVDDRA